MTGEPLKSLRAAVALSRTMRAQAESGDVPDLVLGMHEREILLGNVFSRLEALREQAANQMVEAWPEILGALKDFERENGLLIVALKQRRKDIVHDIARAEGHRRLSAYAV